MALDIRKLPERLSKGCSTNTPPSTYPVFSRQGCLGKTQLAFLVFRPHMASRFIRQGLLPMSGFDRSDREYCLPCSPKKFGSKSNVIASSSNTLNSSIVANTLDLISGTPSRISMRYLTPPLYLRQRFRQVVLHYIWESLFEANHLSIEIAAMSRYVMRWSFFLEVWHESTAQLLADGVPPGSILFRGVFNVLLI